MGREYALLDGEPGEVADAIMSITNLSGPAVNCRGRVVGAVVGMADRLDTLAGCFAIGEKPTGTTDPFGLRRQALGLLHIIRAHRLHVSLAELVQAGPGRLSGIRLISWKMPRTS